MKPFNILLIIICVIALLSCNTAEKNTSSVSENNLAQVESKKLRIEFVYKTNKSDVFTIQMNNIEVDEIQKKNIHFFENVTPTTKDDRVVVEFDANNLSKTIIINLGHKEIKEVEILNISVSYGDNHYSFDTLNDIKKYFAFNRFIDVVEDSKTIQTKRVDGKHNPALSLRQNLIRLLEKE